MQKQFISQLKKILKDEQILLDSVDLKLYETDATSLFNKKPEVVVLPNNTEEVSEIIKAINKYNSEVIEGERFSRDKDSIKESKDVPQPLNFVARGAGTGLSGGAIAADNSVVISLARLDNVLEIDEENKMALVGAGVVNASLAHKLCGTNLHFAPDPSSEKSCTIGGNVAENAGGIHCYKYGVTTDHVLKLEVVMPDGEVLWLGSDRLKADGPDLVKLFIGSEGTFGIATKALVKLTPLPESFLTMQVSFAKVRNASELVAQIIREGFKPAAMEMMDSLTIRAVDEAFNLGFANEEGDYDINAVLLIEVDGDKDEVALISKKIKKIVDSYKPLRYEETQDIDERTRLWKVRKGAVAAFGKIAPRWYLYDSTVPRSTMPDVMDKIAAIAAKYELQLASVAHAADGNLHPNFLYDPEEDTGVIDRIHKASKELMQVSIDAGGVLSGEHGIGVEKQEYMDFMFSPEDLETMMKVRKVFDPQLISNPNKIFPTKICYEASINRRMNKEILGIG